MKSFLGLTSPYGPLRFATYAQIYEQNVSSGDVVKLLGGYNDVSGLQSRGVLTINFMINGEMSDDYVESIVYHELTHGLNHFASWIGQPGEFYATSQQYAYEQKFFASVGTYWASMGVLDRSGNFLSLPAYLASKTATARGNPTGSTTLASDTKIILVP